MSNFLKPKFPIHSKVFVYGIDTKCAGFMSDSSMFGKDEYKVGATVEDFTNGLYIIRLDSGRVLRGMMSGEMKLQ